MALSPKPRRRMAAGQAGEGGVALPLRDRTVEHYGGGGRRALGVSQPFGDPCGQRLGGLLGKPLIGAHVGHTRRYEHVAALPAYVDARRELAGAVANVVAVGAVEELAAARRRA